MLSKNRKEEIISRFLGCSPSLADDSEIRDCLLTIERVYGIGHAVECEWTIRKIRSQNYIQTSLMNRSDWNAIRDKKQKLQQMVSDEINERKNYFQNKDKEYKPEVLKKEDGVLEKLSNFKHRFFTLNF